MPTQGIGQWLDDLGETPTTTLPTLTDLTLDTLRGVFTELPEEMQQANVAELLLGHWIIIRSLGGNFWKRELHLESANVESGFFRSRRDIRVLYTAHLLWKLRGTPGFAALLRKNGNQDFESTYFELVAAEMLSSTSTSIRFVVPSGTKGKDFDLEAKKLWGLESANVEFKCRRAPFQSTKHLRNYLNSCRNQLPDSANGLIFCKISLDDHKISNDDIETTIATWIRASTKRVRYVVLCWDPLEGSEMGTGIAYSAIGPQGASGLLLNDPSLESPLLAISFMRDLGIERIIDREALEEAMRLVPTDSGVVELGSWTSNDRNWWRP